MLIKEKYPMKKAKKFYSLMKTTSKDCLMSAKKFKILIQKQMLKQEKMDVSLIQKDYAMKFMNKMMKN